MTSSPSAATLDILRAARLDMADVLEAAMWKRLDAQYRAHTTGSERVEPVNAVIWQQTIDALRRDADASLAARTLAPPARQPLTEWARHHKVNEVTARGWARKGYLKTARLEGQAYFIDETEPPRRKGSHHGTHD